MNVLSLFDGISCLQLALNRAGIEYANYYASEINKDAIKVTQHHFPNTIQVGDIRFIDWESFPEMDLIAAGSPCQDISGLNKKALGMKGEKSSLFYYVLEARKRWPNAKFLVENVKGKDANIITQELKVKPIKFNSNWIVPQSRPRYYWTNIPVVDIPKRRNLKLSHVLESSVDEKYYQSPAWNKWWAANRDFQISKCFSSLNADIAGCLTARMYVSWNGNFWEDKNGIRRLTTIECERLQTIPDGYTSIISDSKAYEAIGNGWTVDVVAHLLKGLK